MIPSGARAWAAVIAVVALMIGAGIGLGVTLIEELRFRRWLREEQDRMRVWLEDFDDDKR